MEFCAPVPDTIVPAVFLHRPNRFVVEIEVDGAPTTASLPNPGRMQELLLPAASLLCTAGPKGGKHPWRAVAVRAPSSGSDASDRSGGGGRVVPLDTGGTNAVAAGLIGRRSIPGLEEYTIRRAEVTIPGMHGRFDFLLVDPRSGEELLLEVKSCTLFNGPYAMCPDAVTQRGTRHVTELARSTRRAAILFVVHSDLPEFFIPDYHTDPTFSKALYEVRDLISVLAVGLGWNDRLEITTVRSTLKIPWDILPELLEDRGSYLLLLRIDRECSIETGALGALYYAPGYYLYVGSAQRGLSARVNRHRRGGARRKHWHIDYLRERASFVDAYAVREPWRREAEIVRAFRTIANGAVSGFGSSDSPEPSHLMFFSSDPRCRRDFQELVLSLRRFGPERLQHSAGFHGTAGAGARETNGP